MAIAHAWNYQRNIIHRVENPQIGYWLATVMQETEFVCNSTDVWNDPSKAPPLYSTDKTAFDASAAPFETLYQGGDITCFSFQDAAAGANLNGPGLVQLIQNYPTVLPYSAVEVENILGGDGNFVNGALAKSYYDIYTKEVYNNALGFDVYESIDCAADEYAYVKVSASGYNIGINGFQPNVSFFDGSQSANDNWTGLTEAAGGYVADVAMYIALLENDVTSNQYPSDPAYDAIFGGFYNEDIAWTDVERYLSIISRFYRSVNFPTDVTPVVQAKFEELAGGLGGTVPFSEMGPVIDEIILALPYSYPLAVQGSPTTVTNPTECSGNKVPYGSIEIVSGNTELCVGESVTLELVVESGGGSNPTFKWYRNDDPTTIISTERELVISPSVAEEASYGAEICNDEGNCYRIGVNDDNPCKDPRNANGFWVKSEDCSLCPFRASSSAINTECKGTSEGSITLTLTDAPANYEVKYEASTTLGVVEKTFTSSGNTVLIEGLRDGSYSFELTDLLDSDCKAFTNIVVGYNTEINEYVEAELVNIDNCVADIEAKIEELPQPCTWKVKTWNPVTFQWNFSYRASVRTSRGEQISDFYTKEYPAPSKYSVSTNAQIFEHEFQLYSGDTIFFGHTLATYNGSIGDDYQTKLFDEDDNELITVPLPKNNVKFGEIVEEDFYVVSCPYDPPAYEFAWTPAVNEVSQTPTEFVGKAPVLDNEDVTYVVTAINKDNPQCTLKDSVTVLKDPSCLVSCFNPESAQLRNKGVNIDGNVSVCENAILSGYNLTTVTGGVGKFSYELWKDGAAVETNESGVFTLTEEGTYFVEVRDANMPLDVSCQTTSNTINLQIDGPEIEEICLNESNELSFGDGNQWEWFYGGNSLGIQAPNDVLSWTPPSSISEGDIIQLTIDKVAPSALTPVLGGNSLAYVGPSTFSFTVNKPVRLVSFETSCFRLTNSCPAQGQFYNGNLEITGPSGQTIPVSVVAANGGGENNEVVVNAVLQPGSYTMTIPNVSLMANGAGTTSIPGYVSISAGAEIPFTNLKFEDLGTYYPQEGCFPLTMDVTAKSCVVCTQPSKPGIAEGNLELCEDESVQTLTATNVDAGANYVWLSGSVEIHSGEDSTILRNDKLMALGVGTHTITVRAEDPAESTCFEVSDAITVTIDAEPSQPSIVTTDQNICVGNITLDPGAVTGGTWSVNTSASLSGNDATGLVIGDNIFTYSVSSVNGHCLDKTDDVTITRVDLIDPKVDVAEDVNNICEGTDVTFTATITDGGTTPTYQWKSSVNGNVGSNSATYNSTDLVDGEKISVEVSYAEACVNTPVASNEVTVNVTTKLDPSITISADKTTICEGEEVSFSIDSKSGLGSSPTYQWFVAGNSVAGETNETFKSSSLTDGQEVHVKLKVDETCVVSTQTVESNKVPIKVNPNLTPDIQIIADKTSICTGEEVIFSIDSEDNAGSSPTYEWFVGTTSVGNGSEYKSTGFTNGDKVTAVLTSSETCTTSPTATSNEVTINVGPPAIPDVSIQVDKSSICKGDEVTYTAVPSGGTWVDPQFEWFVNTISVQTGSETEYKTSALDNGDVVEVKMTVSETCVTTDAANASAASVTVNAPQEPKVEIIAAANTLCDLSPSTTFSVVNMENEGTSPTFVWVLNTIEQSLETNDKYTPVSLNHGDEVYVKMTSDAGCITTAQVSSDVEKIKVTSAVIPVVEIIETSSSPICEGSPFEAKVTKAEGKEDGLTTFTWYVDNNITTQTGENFSMVLTDGQTVMVKMENLSACATLPFDDSDPLTAKYTPKLDPSVTIQATTGMPVCEGDNINFSATPVQEGAGVTTVEWFVNNASMHTGNTYSPSYLLDGDIVKATLTVSETCVVGSQVVTSTNTIIADVTPLAIPKVTIEADKIGAYCEGEQAVISIKSLENAGATQDYIWKINNLNQTTTKPEELEISSLTSGNVEVSLEVIITDADVCVTTPLITSDPLTINVTPNVVPEVSLEDFVGCEGLPVFMLADAKGTESPSYRWLKNGVEEFDETSFIYSKGDQLMDGDVLEVKVSSGAPCVVTPNEETATATVTIYPNPSPIVQTLDGKQDQVSICENDALELMVVDAVADVNDATWWFEPTGQVATGEKYQVDSVDLSQSGVYYVTLANGSCPTEVESNKLTVNVVETPKGAFITDPNYFIIEDDEATIEAAGSAYDSYVWNIDPAVALEEGDLYVKGYPTETSTVTLTLTNQGLCSTEIKYNLTVTESIKFADAFTPNGDGYNDTWIITGLEVYPQMHIQIFNRWGNLVHEQYNGYEPWNGTREGKELPDGVYFFVLEPNGGSQSFRGTVTIAR